MTTPTPALEWTGRHLRIIDQTLLPQQVRILEIDTEAGAIDAIARLAIRGAPALGTFGAYALVVALDESQPATIDAAVTRLGELRHSIGDARPTAVNLRWAVDRVIDTAVATAPVTVSDLRSALLDVAAAVAAEDEAACAEIGRLGRDLLAGKTRVGTHCNAGRLATAGIGTALAPIYAKAAAGDEIQAFASETRPLLQGARLTAWELSDAGIDVTVVADGAMASLILGGGLDAVIVGADRITANGDVANKIGTLSHALACQAAGIPFYVAAPTSTIDPSLDDGALITIEQRDPDEVHRVRAERLTPEGVGATNPAFDVTPHHLVTAIITDAGVLYPPYTDSIAAAMAPKEGP